MFQQTPKFLSSTTKNWVSNQQSDRFVKLAAKEGFIARSAFKILEIDNRFKLFTKEQQPQVILDLGSAPGSWSQVARQRTHSDSVLIGVDRSPIAASVIGMRKIQGDFMDVKTIQDLQKTLQEQRVSGRIDVCMSDMAPNRAGATGADKFRIAELNMKVLYFAKKELKVGGSLVLKSFGGTQTHQQEVLETAKKNFGLVKIFKPESSRPTSDENFIVCLDKLAQRSSNSTNSYSSGGERLTRVIGSGTGINAKFRNYSLDEFPGRTDLRMRSYENNKNNRNSKSWTGKRR